MLCFPTPHSRHRHRRIRDGVKKGFRRTGGIRRGGALRHQVRVLVKTGRRRSRTAHIDADIILTHTAAPSHDDGFDAVGRQPAEPNRNAPSVTTAPTSEKALETTPCRRILWNPSGHRRLAWAIIARTASVRIDRRP
jgi:hypothetical protein